MNTYWSEATKVYLIIHIPLTFIVWNLKKKVLEDILKRKRRKSFRFTVH